METKEIRLPKYENHILQGICNSTTHKSFIPIFFFVQRTWVYGHQCHLHVSVSFMLRDNQLIGFHGITDNFELDMHY